VSRRAAAIVVIDGKNLEIEHIYVNMTLKAAMRLFVSDIKMNIDTSYDDMRDELADALNRFQFVEISNVTFGRRT